MNRWRLHLVHERLGLQVLVEPLRWRVEVLPGCPADVRGALVDGLPLEGPARNERDAIECAMRALGRVEGWLLARRQPRQEHIFAAEHFDQLRDQDWLDMRIGIEAACMAYNRGWDWVAAAILAFTRQVSAERYSLTASARKAATAVAERFALGMRRRRLPL